MNEASNIEPLEKSLAERIATARRFRQKFKYTGDEEFLMNIIEDLLKREAESLAALELAILQMDDDDGDNQGSVAQDAVRAALAKAKGGAA